MADSSNIAERIVCRYVPREGLYASATARALLQDLIEREIREHGRLAVERARKARRARG